MYNPSNLEYFVFYGSLAVLLIPPLRRWILNLMSRILGLKWRAIPEDQKPKMVVSAKPCPDDRKYFVLSWDSPGTDTILTIHKSMELSRTLELDHLNRVREVVHRSSDTDIFERLPAKGSIRRRIEAGAHSVTYSVSSTFRGQTISDSYYMNRSDHFENLAFYKKWNPRFVVAFALAILAGLWLVRAAWPGTLISMLATRMFIFVAGLWVIGWLYLKVQRKSNALAHLIAWPLTVILFLAASAVPVERRPDSSSPEASPQTTNGRQSRQRQPPQQHATTPVATAPSP